MVRESFDGTHSCEIRINLAFERIIKPVLAEPVWVRTFSGARGENFNDIPVR